METLRLKKFLFALPFILREKTSLLVQDDKSLKRGQFDYRSTADQIAVYKWKDSTDWLKNSCRGCFVGS